MNFTNINKTNDILENNISSSKEHSPTESYELTIIILLCIMLSLYIIIVLIIIYKPIIEWFINKIYNLRNCFKCCFIKISNRFSNNNAPITNTNIITTYTNPLYNNFEIINIDKIPKEINITECSICLQTIKIKKNSITYTNCNHIFHTKCINRWIESNLESGLKTNCPNCRDLITQKYEY